MYLTKITLEPPVATFYCTTCSKDNSIPLDTLRLGFSVPEHPENKNPDVINVDSCSCGSRLMLMRTWDDVPANRRDRPEIKAKAAVNALAKYLKNHGQSRS